MFNTILIANRGEIACRIARTCARLGIRSIAVYSDADADARHTHEADEAIRIGPADAAASYLDADAIIAAAKAIGADAIHPGYGFLSERPVLAELCAHTGIAWIGPRPEAIKAMGSKIAAKRIAQAAAVPSVPGYHGDDQSIERLQQEAERIGFPLLIKASAGGGGKGMRRVDTHVDFSTRLAEAKHEAQRAFGDADVLLERLIRRPRHLEVQLAGDHHGRLVHLFERECSVQRNYQKLIEEAPAARLTGGIREKLYTRALAIGRAIGYDSLGTIEFVLEEGTDEPYFLEMNTRLQVEHTVTEAITGLDLVEWQIRVAAGEALPIAQEAITQRGWAIEARVNCENPAAGYRPELGTITRYVEPVAPGLRVDSGVQIGMTIPPNYDSLIAKVIAWGGTRGLAIDRLAAGLADYEIDGVGTNQLFLRDILLHDNFRNGSLTTRFIDEAFPDGWRPHPAIAEDVRIAAAFALLAQERAAQSSAASAFSPWSADSAFRTMRAAGRHGGAQFVLESDNAEACDVELQPESTYWRVQVGDAAIDVSARWDEPDSLAIARLGDAPRTYRITRGPEGTTVAHRGVVERFRALSRLEAMARMAVEGVAIVSDIKASMPGLVTAIEVEAGATVDCRRRHRRPGGDEARVHAAGQGSGPCADRPLQGGRHGRDRRPAGGNGARRDGSATGRVMKWLDSTSRNSRRDRCSSTPGRGRLPRWTTCCSRC